MAWNEEEEAAAVVVVVEEEEEEEEEALQKITKEDHATCQASFLPNHGKKFVRSPAQPPLRARQLCGTP